MHTVAQRLKGGKCTHLQYQRAHCDDIESPPTICETSPTNSKRFRVCRKGKRKKRQKRVTKRGLILLDAAIMKNTHLGAVQLKQGNLPAVSPHLTSDHKM